MAIDMLIASEKKYINQLSGLWQKVFADEIGYIDLFFKNIYYKSKTFAAFDGDKIISVLYLMDSKIRFNGQLYRGFYLYAAATDSDYRRKGIMGTLLKEAQQYTKAIGKDYISLVPGNAPLYDYYSKFGFESAMYKCVSKGEAEMNNISPEKVKANEYKIFRDLNVRNAFLWDEEELSYALDCFSYYDIIPYMTDKAVFILDKENSSAKELICKQEDFCDTINVIGSLCGKKDVFYESFYGKEKIPFGMIYPVNENLKREWSMDDIYMNLALD